MALDWLPTMPRDVGAWADALRAMTPEAARRRALAIVHAWIDGGLHDWWRPGEPRALDRALASSMAALGDLSPEHVSRDGRGEVDHDTRRWCWIECWTISEQDEDLFLMSPQHVLPLLEEAAHHCPKRDYALSIVAHGVRDGAHAMIVGDQSSFRDTVAAYAEWIEPARRARDERLAAYLTRLVGYARPGKVDRAQALARVSDLTRCHAPEPPQVERAGDHWRGSLGEDVLIIDAAFGDMRVERR